MASRGEGLGTLGFPGKECLGSFLGSDVGNLDVRVQDAMSGDPEASGLGALGRGVGGIFHGSRGCAEGRPPPPSSVSTTLVESWVSGEIAEQKEGNGGGGRRTRNLRLSLEFSGGICVPVFPRGRAPKSSLPRTWFLITSLPSTHAVSRNERSHCPSQTVKKLLEEQRRRQQQPDAGGAPVRSMKPCEP